MPKRKWFQTTRRQRREFRDTGDALTVGWMLVVSILIGFGLGYFADRWFGIEPWGMLIGLAFGIGAGFYNLIAFAIRLSREDDPDDEDGP